MNFRDRSIWTAIVLGGFIAGTIDIGSACVINLLDPVTILHAIASGLLGRASFYEGAPSAVLGLLLQLSISLVIAAIYVLAAHYLPVLLRRWIAGGLAYGVGVFFVMNYVVVPLSAARPHHNFPHFTPVHFVGNLLAMLLFGLIVSYLAQRPGRARESTDRLAAEY
ncbi:MAG TPA: hypothetical protein VGL35_01880 [Rhizomicrobium sp.]|jgi:uncharacterized membrane protein YagU involved in acid resistance